MNGLRAVVTAGLAVVAIGSVAARQPSDTITAARATVTIKGHLLDGAFTYDRVGDLTLWGPGGGVIDIASDRGDAFQYSPMAKPGAYKTTPSMPLIVQVGVGPAVKIVASSGGECTVTLTRADDSGVAGAFECGRVGVMGPEKKMLGPVDSMTGSFSATR
ncbi:MAG: hypothetical protein V7647_3462 [Acidobacteriota bacterium]